MSNVSLLVILDGFGHRRIVRRTVEHELIVEVVQLAAPRGVPHEPRSVGRAAASRRAEPLPLEGEHAHQLVRRPRDRRRSNRSYVTRKPQQARRAQTRATLRLSRRVLMIGRPTCGQKKRQWPRKGERCAARQPALQPAMTPKTPTHRARRH